MPLFEFVCTDCNQPFEELLRSSNAIAEVTCPTCGSPQVKKKLSTFASKVSGGVSFSLSSSAASSCSTGGG
jgi:putative FmdB family regulatory protein